MLVITASNEDSKQASELRSKLTRKRRVKVNNSKCEHVTFIYACPPVSLSEEPIPVAEDVAWYASRQKTNVAKVHLGHLPFMIL